MEAKTQALGMGRCRHTHTQTHIHTHEFTCIHVHSNLDNIDENLRASMQFPQEPDRHPSPVPFLPCPPQKPWTCKGRMYDS